MANDSKESMPKDHSNKKRSESPVITESNSFRNHLDSLVASLEQLFLACAPESAQRTTAEEWPPTFFSLTGCQERPSEFLQCWLDLIHVMFEPNPPGTMYLNSNWDFVRDSVPQVPFRLGYLTLTLACSGAGDANLLGEQLRDRAAHLRYDLRNAYGTFVCMSMGADAFRRSLSATSALQAVFGAGVSVADVLSAISNSDDPAGPRWSGCGVHVGTALDASLPGGLMRGSLLAFLPAPAEMVQ